MSKPGCRLSLACLLLALLAPPLPATDTYLHPRAIFEGDIAELVIEYDSKIASLYALDTGPLAVDFEILDIKSRVFRIDQIAPGEHRMQWRLYLLPRRNGRLVVPSIRFGDQSTAPLALEVKPVPDDVRSSQEVFVELDSEPRSPYVGQQTRLSLRLYHNTPLRIDGLAEPRLTEAASYRDGNERVYFEERDGTEFRVLERRMLIFPRQAGELEVPPAVLRGQLRQPGIAAADTGSTSRKISRSSGPLRLRVRAPPADYSGRYWLPARDLAISQRLQQHVTGLRIGDSIDWMLTLEARGLPAASLPANLLEFEAQNYSVYADQARRSDRLEDGELFGRLEQRFAIIVTAAGALELPAINLAWWDVAADRERQAHLEGTHLGFAHDSAPGSERQSTTGNERLFIPVSDGGRRWIQQLAGLIGVAVLLFALHVLWRRFEQTIELGLRRWRIRGLLKQACRDNQARRARALLIEWGRARWPDQAVNGLYAVRDRCQSVRLTDELSRLDAALFSPAARRWHGGGLWAAFAAGPRIAADNRRDAWYCGLYSD